MVSAVAAAIALTRVIRALFIIEHLSKVSTNLPKAAGVAVIIRRLWNWCQAQQNNESVAHVRSVRGRTASMVALWQLWETPSIRSDVEIFRPCSSLSIAAVSRPAQN